MLKNLHLKRKEANICHKTQYGKWRVVEQVLRQHDMINVDKNKN